MNALKQLFKGDVRQFGMLFALLALVLFFQWQTTATCSPPPT